MKYLLLFTLILSVLGSNAQYTYFNNTYGEFGDQETEKTTNVVVVGDSIYLFGGIDNDQIPFSVLLRIIGVNGDLIDERIINKSYPEFLIGQGNAVGKIGNDKFLFTQKIYDGVDKGVAIMYNYSLDTLWEKTYSLFPETSTYFRSNFSKENIYLILGEHNNLLSSFLVRINEQGEVLWQKNLKDGSFSTAAYINENLVFTDTGYLIGGFKRTYNDIAMLTKTDLEGNIEWEYYADNFEDDEGEQADTRAYRLAQLPNGDIIGAHMVWYEYYGTQPWNNQDPSWYRSLHLSKINVEDSITTYWEHDYFTDQEFTGSNLWKILPTDDNGIIAMGANEVYAENAWVAKIDSSGVLEWFNFYSLDISQTQESYYPYDIEQTSDGGYVIVGEYFSYNEDNFKKSWVMKIDACGDTEWQGCDYVGIQESIQSKQFKIYPNPATQEVQLEGELLTPGDKVKVFDLSGRLVLQETWYQNSIVNISDLAKGMYQLTVTNDTGNVIGQKLVVE